MDRIEASIVELTIVEDATVAKLDKILHKLALLENRCQFSKVLKTSSTSSSEKPAVGEAPQSNTKDRDTKFELSYIFLDKKV